MRRFPFKFLLTLAAVILSLAAAVHFSYRSGLFNITTMQVEIANNEEIANLALAQDIQQVLQDQLKSYIGMNTWQVALTDLKANLMQNNWVEFTEIHRSLPDAFMIKVRLKPISSIWLNDKGQFIPVSATGDLMDAVALNKMPDVPLLVGSQFDKDEVVRRKAVQLISEIPNSGLFKKSNVSEIHYKPQEGFWLTMMHSGLQVKLGEDQVGLKSERVAQVLEYIESHSLDARVIDANLSKKVLVRLRKDP